MVSSFVCERQNRPLKGKIQKKPVSSSTMAGD